MNESAVREKLLPLVDELIRLEELLIRCLEAEKDALLLADLTLIQDASASKQQLIESLAQLEARRVRLVGSATMREIVLDPSGELLPPTRAELESRWENLRQLVSIAVDKNRSNQQLLSSSMKHIENMKRNILGESVPKSGTYSAQGSKVAGSNQQGARKIIKEV
jgi:flagellar biosynthesis/type III secretory pathway chaperone